jgi:hypothetical protein
LYFYETTNRHTAGAAVAVIVDNDDDEHKSD